jgi:hypothetical protein
MSSTESQKPLTWNPLPGPQTDAFECAADILFYGGAAGGGKTDLLIGAACKKHHRSIIFRREYAQLKGIIDRTAEIFGDAGRFNRSQLIWTLDDDRMIEFGAVQHFGDERKYQGRAHDLKAFDELAHFSEAQFRMLCGWLRSADPNQRCRVIATGNPPTDSEGRWIIRYFAPWLDKAHPNPATPGELRWYTTINGRDTEVESGELFENNGEQVKPKSRTFIPARVEDNKYYMESGYKATLQALPEPLRAQMLYGDFSVGAEDNPQQVIPVRWLELAIKRYEVGVRPDGPVSCIGVDVARGGGDRTVITLRTKHWFDPQRAYPGAMTPDGETVAQLVLAMRGTSQCRVNVDVIGVGASAFDSLRRHIGAHAVALNASQASQVNDKSGQISFVNRRAEWWWTLREALDPGSGCELALPSDRELFSDLAAPRFKFTPRGVQIESKDDIISRLGRSPDKGDSLVYAFAELRTPGDGYIKFYAQQGLDSQ